MPASGVVVTAASLLEALSGAERFVVAQLWVSVAVLVSKYSASIDINDSSSPEPSVALLSCVSPLSCAVSMVDSLPGNISGVILVDLVLAVGRNAFGAPPDAMNSSSSITRATGASRISGNCPTMSHSSCVGL